MNAIRNFIRDEEGLSAVEYVLAGALVCAGIAAAFAALGQEIINGVNTIITAMGGTPI